jgi:hypothetical protein
MAVKTWFITGTSRASAASGRSRRWTAVTWSPEALGGTITVHSPVGAGTSLHAQFPIPD